MCTNPKIQIAMELIEHPKLLERMLLDVASRAASTYSDRDVIRTADWRVRILEMLRPGSADLADAYLDAAHSLQEVATQQISHDVRSKRDTFYHKAIDILRVKGTKSSTYGLNIWVWWADRLIEEQGRAREVYELLDEAIARAAKTPSERNVKAVLEGFIILARACIQLDNHPLELAAAAWSVKKIGPDEDLVDWFKETVVPEWMRLRRDLDAKAVDVDVSKCLAMLRSSHHRTLANVLMSSATTTSDDWGGKDSEARRNVLRLVLQICKTAGDDELYATALVFLAEASSNLPNNQFDLHWRLAVKWIVKMDRAEVWFNAQQVLVWHAQALIARKRHHDAVDPLIRALDLQAQDPLAHGDMDTAIANEAIESLREASVSFARLMPSEWTWENLKTPEALKAWAVAWKSLRNPVQAKAS